MRVNLKTDSGLAAVIKETALHAGTDCIGFAQRSAMWGDFYKWKKLPLGIAEGSEDYGGELVRNYPYVDASSWKISSKNDTYQIVVNGEVKTLNSDVDKIVPGDVFFYTLTSTQAGLEGKDKGSHIAIVQEVTYTEGRTTEIAKIKLIESTFGATDTEKIQNIIKENTINFYNLKNKNWFVVRLMPE
jgi:hypothetical protein